jgi:UTP-glucose-1-phosphate uridylyltransferase
MQKIRKSIIPAAGFGTRFLPENKAMPKEMLPLVDKLPFREETRLGKGGEIQMTDALRVMAHMGHVYAYNFQGKRYDTGG